MRTKNWGASERRAVAIALVAASVMAVGVVVGLLLERNYWRGYNDAYNSVQAEYERGVGDGWRGCIEENNLYERY